MQDCDQPISVLELAGDVRPTSGDLPDIRSRVPADEWQARVELAALYRLVAHFKWTDGIYNHISLRLPGDETFLVNPFGYLYEEITASSLVKVDVDGTIVDDPTGLGINPAGFVIHGAIHEARRDVACVLHTHTRAGCAVAAQSGGLLPISLHAAALYGRIGYHEFEGIVLDLDERSRLIANLDQHPALMLRNHGLLTAGRSPGEALYLMQALQAACEIQLAALTAGVDNLRTIGESALEQVSGVISTHQFERDWAASLRLAHRIAPDFAC